MRRTFYEALGVSSRMNNLNCLYLIMCDSCYKHNSEVAIGGCVP